jgi:hypothetical protein
VVKYRCWGVLAWTRPEAGGEACIPDVHWCGSIRRFSAPSCVNVSIAKWYVVCGMWYVVCGMWVVLTMLCCVVCLLCTGCAQVC